MTNVEFADLEDYNDISIKSRYQAMAQKGISDEKIRAELCPLSRDNARTPYQWDGSENAGFTTGSPWLKLNPRFTQINLEADRRSPDSIFAYYRKLIAMRREDPAILDGLFEMLLPEHRSVVMYLRRCTRQTLLVIANFSNDENAVELPQQVIAHKWTRLLTNCEGLDPSLERDTWQPWEAEIYELSE